MDIFSSQSTLEALNIISEKSRQRQSIRALSKKLGYSSDRALGMVLQGQRLPTPRLIEKMADYYKLSEKEKNYLRLLTSRDYLKRKNLSTQQIESEIKSYRSAVYKKKALDSHQISALAHWSSFAIIEILQVSGRSMSFDEIRHLLDENISASELKMVLKNLVQFQFIKTDRNLFSFEESNTYFYSYFDVPTTFIREAHRQQLQRAMKALEDQSVLDREFSLKTFTIPKSKIPQMKKMIRDSFEELSDRILSLADEKSNQEKNVYQMNIQFYRQSKDF